MKIIVNRLQPKLLGFIEQHGFGYSRFIDYSFGMGRRPILTGRNN
jgi:hypothetical protein